ncbi:putative LPS assembly protein LptD [Lewinella cohaerens]|uniref:putative LPS assembly protein LptD n=3 Tax=Lewinella TaxID=70994 RepID=UPI00037806DE|nr:putative LPS assembly protein LptD [Lewinella cohaerens]
MKTKLLFSFWFFLVFSILSAQDTTLVQQDTFPETIQVDTLGQDSSLSISLGVPVSQDALEAAVDYNADTMKLNARNQKIYLYGNAFVSYTNITLKADYIELDWSKSEVLAQGVRNDTTGVLEGTPEFTEGENTFVAKRMRYNFETRKGIVYDVTTEEDDIRVKGARSKFISAPPGDTTAHDIIYSEDAIFTTCTADHPHFGIRSRKQKVIPNKLVVIGPSNLEIMDVPTPLWLPFGFFPVSGGRSTGLIFPRDYEYSEQWGFGLKQIGWFFPLGDNFNLTVAGDIYLEGTYGLGAAVQYRKRYGYNGNFNFRFDSRRQEEILNVLDPDTGETMIGPNGNIVQESVFRRANGILLNWSHNQDAAAHPMNRLGGSINFQTNNFQQRVFNDARSVGTNVINSNFTFSRNWLDKPISMSVAFRHSQNTRTRSMNVDFPTFQFQTQALYPFRKKERVGAKRWYEDITLRYTNEARANFTAPDTAFFERQTLDNARYGMQQTASAGTSFKVLKYFNLNPGVNMKEVWYMEELDLTFDSENGVVQDTTYLPNGDPLIETVDFGTWIQDTVPGFTSYRTYSANLSLNTQIFGTYRFDKGRIRGLRHVIKPNISIGYQPDYINNRNYYDSVTDTLDITTNRLVSRYQDGIFGAPPSSEMQMALNYSITNIFEAKIFSRKDSTERNIKLFDNIYINGNYNFAADTLKWSPIAITGTTRLFKGATTFSFNTTFDPHIRQETSEGSGVFQRINQTTWQQNGKPFEFVNATFRFNTNLTVSKIRALFQGKEEEIVEEVDRDGNELRPVDETDFLSLFENFSIRHNLTFGVTPLSADRDTFQVNTHSLELRGSLGLTPNWNVDIGSIGYDFARKQTTYPYLGLRRDLHCWEMGFNWAPTRNTYSFYLRVKPGTLDFLKVPYQRNNADGSRAFE